MPLSYNPFMNIQKPKKKLRWKIILEVYKTSEH